MHKYLIGSIVLLLVTGGWGARSGGQEVATPRGELRVVNRHLANWAWVTWNVLEHLIEVDKDGQLIPKLATGWRWLDDRTLEVIIRQGVTFHNGEVFDAEIVKLNWDENTRFQQPHIPGKYLNFQPGSRLEIVNPYTVRLRLPAPDGAVLAKLVLLHMANRQFYRDVGWGEKHW